MGSSYAAEIMEAIPNLHVGINAHNQVILAGEAGSNKTKKPFTEPYYAYHWFYRNRTEDCHDIQMLADQRMQKKHNSPAGGNRSMNYSLYQSNELHCGQRRGTRNERRGREIGQRERKRSQERKNATKQIDQIFDDYA
ncbi:hypothetical protein Fot_24376 [Forsythia ovata]|uniref:Uncharacterized protein n=1 Tax=Forsythia ovata TaxID=205694 RepID=A0ABD1U620_9LAMI